MIPITLPKQTTKTSRLLLRANEKRTLLVLVDFLVGVMALFLSLYNWASVDEFSEFNIEFLQRQPAWLYLLPLLWLLFLVESYDQRRSVNWRQTVRMVISASLLGLGLYLILYFVATPKQLPRRGVSEFFLSVTLLTLLWRMVFIRVFTAPQFMRRVLLVGAGETGRTILNIVKGMWPPPFFWVGLIDDDPRKQNLEIDGYPVLGTNSHLLDLINDHGVTDIVVAISGEMHGEMFQSLLDAQEMGVTIIRMPVIYEEIMGRVPIKHLEADWILRSFVDQAPKSGFYELSKRLLDFAVGLVGGAIFVALLPFVAAAIVIDNGWPIFYSQTRLGRGGAPYRIIKFRTMCNDAEPNGLPQWAEENDRRATRVGRILRKTHLDELPQFINILKGEMSMVGPRAERPELVAWFQNHVPFYRARLLVKPGLTGWAQINFGYASSIDETIVKLEYDLYYIKHRNLMLDLVVLLRTPATVLGLKGR